MGVATKVVLKSTIDEITVYEALNAFTKFNKEERNFNTVNIKGDPIWKTSYDNVTFYPNSTHFFINVGSKSFENDGKLREIEEDGRFKEEYGVRQVFFCASKHKDHVCFEGENKEAEKGMEVTFRLGCNDEAIDYLNKFCAYVAKNKQALFENKAITLFCIPHDYNDDIELYLKEDDKLQFTEYYNVIVDHRNEKAKTLDIEEKIDQNVKNTDLNNKQTKTI